MYDHILLPTDGSEGVSGAIEEAIALADAHDATLHVLYVVDTSAAAAVPTADVANIQDLLETAGNEALSDVSARAAEHGVSVETHTARGVIHDVILEYADETPVDIIVMGTHGRSGLDRLLLGSVTERVIKRATQPVLVIRTTAGQ